MSTTVELVGLAFLMALTAALWTIDLIGLSRLIG